MSSLRVTYDRRRRTLAPEGGRGSRVSFGPPGEAVALPQGQGWLLFDGRIDNRGTLWRALPSSPGPRASVSDAVLVAAGYVAWGLDLFRRLLGSFTIAVHDHARREVILARDPMGGRNLAYALDPRFLIAATEEAEVLADPRVDGSLDPERLASYFALETPTDGRTFFRGVRELPPGHLLRVGPTASELRSFWQPDLEARPVRREGELAEEVRALLAEAVACRLRAAPRTGVLLSGGLDSAPIAGLARRALGPSAPLDAFAWTFERHPRADERRYIADAARAFDLTLYGVPCDDALPFSDLPFWPVHPKTPEQNAYRLFHQRAFERARQAGCRLLLSGMCGDQLYTGGEESWLAESWRGGGLSSTLAALGRAAAAGTLRRVHGAALLPWTWRLERQARRQERRFPWLTAGARARLEDPVARDGWAGRFLRPRQALLLLGPANGHGFAVERHFARQAGVEITYPLRDRRLVERFLTLPASALHRPGETRPILRRALADLLPPSIAARQDKASFESLFVAGVYRKNVETTRRLLLKREATWPELVERRYVLDALAREDTGLAGVVLWLAASLELWLERRGEAAEGPMLRLAA